MDGQQPLNQVAETGEPAVMEAPLMTASPSTDAGENLKSSDRDFYQQLRDKIRKWLESDAGKTNKWAEYILVVPDVFHLLCKLTLEPEVMLADKAKLAVAVAYYVSPLDLLPELILGPVGYADDLALACFVLNSIVNNTDSEVIKRHWAGEGDILDIVQKVLKTADEMIGSGLWTKIRKMVG
ncbi:MAG: YkvA family protein [Solirubrobacterales bacterium]